MPRFSSKMQADVVVVGSGPGGATTARELARRGKKVIICEAGGYHRRFGCTPFLLSMMEKFGLTFSREGTWVLIPKTVGGASVVFCGTVRIGRLLDKDCQTPIENCFCLDTTIIPEPWGLPPSVTVVAMAKRLAKRLAGN